MRFMQEKQLYGWKLVNNQSNHNITIHLKKKKTLTINML
jgi:hypothetical protein